MLSGYWFCTVCNGPADIEDPGEAFPRCVKCGERGLRWREVAAAKVVDRRPVDGMDRRQGMDASGVTWARLALARRDLRLLAAQGYWFCTQCDCVTERREDGACALCGAAGGVMR